MTKSAFWISGLAAAFLTCGTATAKVSPEEAAQLGMPDENTPLTPVGAERSGNAEGTIPAWSGGIVSPPAGYSPGDWYIDPYADDEILFTITAQNYKQYEDKLNIGTKALFERYPDTFKMNIYPTRRSASYPDWYYEGSIYNATHTEFCGNPEPTLAERCVKSDSHKRGVYFPIPKTGGEVAWNHSYFYWGTTYEAHAYGFNAYADGSYADHLKVDRWIMPHVMTAEQKNPDPYFQRGGGALLCGSQEDIYPPRTAGQMFGGCNSYASNDFDAYLYIPGQRRVRKAPEIGFYDSPGTGSDGLRTADQRWGWAITGDEEWYEYLPPRKQEMYVPYNAYKMAQPGITFDDVSRSGHMNQDLKRYELHRVWVLEGTLRPQFRHLGPHRLAYIDEDSWAATGADMYDARGQLWRVSELYNINFYDHKFTYFWADAHMDLLNGRYASVNAWFNIGIKDGHRNAVFNGEPRWDYQKPAGLRRMGIR